MLTLASPADARTEIPRWLAEALREPTPTSATGARSIILLKEMVLTVHEDGSISEVERGVVRILAREGLEDAACEVYYHADTDRVRQVRAWVVKPSGEASVLGDDRVVDGAVIENHLYSEVRWKRLRAGADATIGSVLGYETILESATVFSQLDWVLGGRVPVLRARLALQVPSGMRTQCITMNHAPIEPTTGVGGQEWQLRDIPAFEDEAAAPPLSALAPRLAVSWFSREGAPPLPGPSFGTWAEVARWLWALAEPSAVAIEPLATKAKSLVEGARTESDTLRAIARHVQKIPYAAIAMGLGRGGGYRPHPAGEVLRKSYGDCKDKANLMRVLLGSLGIEAHLVVIRADDPSYVRAEWPSPRQFNHCIVGLRSRTIRSPGALVDSGTEGELLLFDPTDSATPLGGLPAAERGSLALVVSPRTQALVQVPGPRPEDSRLERRVLASLEPDGSLAGSIRETSIGQAAAGERRMHDRSASDYRRLIESWITESASGATVSGITVEDDWDSGRFLLRVDFAMPRYAQDAGQGLLLFRPALASRRSGGIPEDVARTQPILIPATAESESLIVTLPAGLVIDELPEGTAVATRFGSYSTSLARVGGALIFTRSLRLERVTVPAAEFGLLRGFMDTIRRAEEAPVILARR